MAAIVTHAPIVDRSRIIGAYGPPDRTVRRRGRPGRRVLRDAPQIGADEIDVLVAAGSERAQSARGPPAHSHAHRQERRIGSLADLRQSRNGNPKGEPAPHLGSAPGPTRALRAART